MTLSYLKIEIWGFPYPPNKVELDFSDGKIAYSFNNRLQYSREGEYFDFDSEKRKEIEDFLSTFKKRLYMPKGQVLDGEYWELEFRYEGEEKPHRKRGENAWPPLWNYLMEAVDEVAEGWNYLGEWYTYCSVRPEHYDRDYYYLSKAGECEAGDKVVIPFGKQIMSGVVTKVEVFRDDELPLPLEKMKEIMTKVPDGFDTEIEG